MYLLEPLCSTCLHSFEDTGCEIKLEHGQVKILMITRVPWFSGFRNGPHMYPRNAWGNNRGGWGPPRGGNMGSAVNGPRGGAGGMNGGMNGGIGGNAGRRNQDY